MKKLLLALPLVAGASWAGTTYYAGNQTQEAYTKLLSQLNQLKPFTLESESYSAGFMTSTAVTNVLDSNGPNARVLFRLQHTINHSPVGNDNGETRLGASSISTKLKTDEITDQKAQQVLSGFDNSEPFELHTIVKLTGEVDNNLVLNKFQYSAEGDTLSAAGGQFAILSDASGKVQGSGTIGEIAFTNASGTKSTVAPSTSSFDLNRVAESIYNGNMSFDMPSIYIQSPATGLNVELKDVSLTSEQTMQDDILANSVALKAGQIESPLPIDSASWIFTMDGFSLDSMQQFNELDAATPLVHNENIDPNVAAENELAALKSLIAPGVGMNTSVVVSNSGGHIGASLNLGFVGDGTASGYDSIASIGDLLQALTGRVLVDADADAVMQTPAAMFLMDPSIGRYVVSDGVKYTSDIQMADLTLYINGEPQSIQDMIGPMMGMPLDTSMLVQ